ncbi:MAG: helix-turn-helix domain-containing protein [Bdellovibrionales bacterium]|nr:helix-turn-helix domain-containing protein [Bdellovibrionales bacterium]
MSSSAKVTPLRRSDLDLVASRNSKEAPRETGGPAEKFFDISVERNRSAKWDPFLSPKKAAEYLDVSVKFVYEHMLSRDLPSHHVGRLRKIRLSDLEAWLARQHDRRRT